MIAAWMAYTLVVGILLGGAAWVTERISRRAGAPTRWVWGVAMCATLAWPLLAEIFRSTTRTAPPPGSIETPGTFDPVVFNLVEPLANRAALFDPVLLSLWLVASTLGVALLIWTDRRTRRLLRRLPTVVMSGVPVRVSHELGPAVVGWPAGSIVVPQWTEELEDTERHLIIAHESHHQRAHDALLLGIAAIAVAFVPWHFVMWWMTCRLRAAVEFDCDARVLRDGTAPATYAALLCSIAGRPRHPLRPALAISHPTSLLARRIDHMLKPIVRTHPGFLALAGLVVGGIIVAACEVPTPPTEAPASDLEFKTQLGSSLVERQIAHKRANETVGGVDRQLAERASAALAGAEKARKEEFDRMRTDNSGSAEMAFGSVIRLRQIGQSNDRPGPDGVYQFGSEGGPVTYVDDVLVTSLDGITPDRIARIDVIKGPAAERILGHDAAGGVIKIYTKPSSR